MSTVSILIPCHNNAAWVAGAIESALGQTHPRKEVVVLDDGSADDSPAVIRSFGDRIRWEIGPNRGGNAARNRLLELAQGDWVQFLDADDCLLPDKVEAQAAVADAATDAVYGAVTLEWWTGRGVDRRRVSAPDPGLDIHAHWLNWQLAQTGAVLWRAAALRRIGGWNEAYPCCQDNEVCLRALTRGLSFKLSQDAGAVYRIRPGETVSRARDPGPLVRVKTGLMDQMIDWLAETGRLREIHRRIAARACFRMARTLAAHDRARASAYARERRRRGLFECRAGDAPAPYRILHRLAGFGCAEAFAAFARRTRRTD